MFDLTNQYSFNSLKSWIDEIKECKGNDYSNIVILGNKSDLEGKYQISDEYIENVISKWDYKDQYQKRPHHPLEYYVEVSRKIIILVEKFFNSINNNEKLLFDFIKNSDVLITENSDVIFQGFLYLNYYEKNDYFIKRALRYINADIFEDDY